MTRTTALAMGLSALLALAACDRGADADGDGKITDAEAAAEMGTVKLEPGQWEATVTVTDATIDQVPAGAPADLVDQLKRQKTVTKSCISKEQAENPSAEFFAVQKDVKCDMKKFSMTGGKIDADMTCTPNGTPGTLAITMVGDYGPAAYDMMMDTTATSLPGGMTIKMTTKAVGKRVGDCPA